MCRLKDFYARVASVVFACVVALAGCRGEPAQPTGSYTIPATGADLRSLAKSLPRWLCSKDPGADRVIIRADLTREVLLVDNATPSQVKRINEYLAMCMDVDISMEMFSVHHRDAREMAALLQDDLARRDGYEQVRVIADRRTQQLIVIHARQKQLEAIRSRIEALDDPDAPLTTRTR